MSPSLSTHKPRQNGLQLLRIFAAVLVLLHHASAIVSDHSHGAFKVFDTGTLGVDIFFVLSGFVMVYSSVKLATMEQGWAVFAQRRLVRIVPTYWMFTSVMLAGAVFLPSLFQRNGSILWRAICSFLFLPCRDLGGAIHPIVVVGWTLNYEMFFYMLFAISLLFRWNVFVFLGAVLGLLAGASYIVPPNNTALAFYLNPVVAEFYFGMVLAHLYSRSIRTRSVLAVPVFVIASVVLLWPFPLIDAWRPWRAGLPAAVIVWAALEMEPLLHRTPRFLLLLADASYVIYLSHVMIMLVLARLVSVGTSMSRQLLLMTICVLLPVGVGALLHLWLEIPLLRWFREKWTVDGQKTIQVH